MKSATLGLMLMLTGIPFPCSGDLYKYLDADGRLHFTDAPLMGDNLRLEWKQASKQLVEKSSRDLLVSIRHKAPGLSKKISVRRNRYAALIRRVAQRFELRPELLHAVIRAESAYDPKAVSPAGAIGLMQLMPATAARYKVSDRYDPDQNVRGGACYLRFLLDRFKQNVRLALAGYNAGENAVIKHDNRVPPYPETQRYVRKVLQFLWAERITLGRWPDILSRRIDCSIDGDNGVQLRIGVRGFFD